MKLCRGFNATCNIKLKKLKFKMWWFSVEKAFRTHMSTASLEDIMSDDKM